MFRPDWEGGDGMAGSSGWPTFRGFYPHASARGSGVRMQPYRPRPRSIPGTSQSEFLTRDAPKHCDTPARKGKRGGYNRYTPSMHFELCMGIPTKTLFSVAVGSLAIRAIGCASAHAGVVLAASNQKGLLFGRKHSRSIAQDPTHRMFGLPRRSETFQPVAPSHHTRKNIPGPLFGIHRSRCLGFSFPLCLYVDPGGLGHLSCCRQACFRLLGTDDPYHLFFTLIGFWCQAVGAGRQLFVS